MMKPLLAALVLLPTLAFGQVSVPRVSLDARGDDVREVLATLFAQAHRPYALDASIKGKLYVKLDGMPFPKALNVVLTQANLIARDQDGVTMIVPKPSVSKAAAPKPLASKGPDTTKPDSSKPAPLKPIPSRSPLVVAPKRVEKDEPPARIDPKVLAHRVTTRLSRAPLADVFASLSEQVGVPIELDPAVPAYRVDAFFVKTSLRYTLDRLCKAAGLRYEPTADGIRIVRA